MAIVLPNGHMFSYPDLLTSKMLSQFSKACNPSKYPIVVFLGYVPSSASFLEQDSLQCQVFRKAVYLVPYTKSNSQVPFGTMNQHGICYHQCCCQAHLWYQSNLSERHDPKLNCAPKRVLFNPSCHLVQVSQSLGSFRGKSLLIHDNYVVPIFPS